MDVSIYGLPKEFPSNLLAGSLPLDGIGINQLAWKFDQVLTVVEFLGEHNYAILGGDVYKVNNGAISITNGNWYVNRKNSAISWEQYVLECKNKAISYIKQYRDINGDDFYYAVSL